MMIQKKLTLFALAAGIAFAGHAQDHQPLEKAQNAALLLTEKSPAQENPQIEVKPDIGRPYLVTGSNNLGALVIPDKRLKNREPLKSGGKPIPIGQLWMRGLAPEVDGSKVAGKDLREVTIATDEEDGEVTAYLLAARLDGDKATLLVYGKPKKPIATLKLKEAKTYQELPLELDAAGEDSGATLFFNVVGRYVAELKIVEK
jgi:hypothetical protein